MTAQASARSGRPAFPRIAIDASAGGDTYAAPSGDVFSIVRAADIAKADQGRQLVNDAWMQADQILADAHAQAAAYLASSRANMATAQAAWYAEQAALFESRATVAVDLLCRTTGQIAEAVIAAIFERVPLLPVQSSVEIAVRLLRAEMRAQVLCHPQDFEAVSAASKALGSVLTQTDDAVRPGELMFRGVQGEVSVDGTDALLHLLADWKSALSTALPVLATTPIFSSSTSSSSTSSSVPESENTP